MSIFRSIVPTIARSYGWRCFATGFPSDSIAELNKEMESIFGESPAPNPLGSSPPQQPDQPTSGSRDAQPALTHIDSSGQAKMVNVSPKQDSERVAIDSCRILLGQKAFNLVASNQIAKGDVLTVAKIAGITGTKQTCNLIPLCHNINLSHVHVDLTLNEEDSSVVIEGEAATNGKTWVEMEAMTAVSIAGLTVYDMCKAASKDICITDICLQHKSGERVEAGPGIRVLSYFYECMNYRQDLESRHHKVSEFSYQKILIWLKCMLTRFLDFESSAYIILNSLCIVNSMFNVSGITGYITPC